MAKRDEHVCYRYGPSAASGPSWTPHFAVYLAALVIAGMVFTLLVAIMVLDRVRDIRVGLAQGEPMLYASLVLLFLVWCLSLRFLRRSYCHWGVVRATWLHDLNRPQEAPDIASHFD